MNGLPCVIVIDDMLGRQWPDGSTLHRMAFCANFGLADNAESSNLVADPIARADFIRGQMPTCSLPGDHVANSMDQIREAIAARWTARRDKSQPPWAMALLDLNFRTGVVPRAPRYPRDAYAPAAGGDDGMFGVSVAQMISAEFPELPLVVMSDANPDAHEHALSGARMTKFLSKTAMDARIQLRDFLGIYGLLSDPIGEIIGCSLPLLTCLREARIAASILENDKPIASRILLRGETGTGKQLVARYINRFGGSNGQRRSFLEVGCGETQGDRMAALLLGTKRGSFTGATQDITGVFEKAKNGDLFLDEVGQLDAIGQNCLFRVLDGSKVQILGGTKYIDVHGVRVIAATDAVLEDSVRQGDFARQLHARFQDKAVVCCPPLGERFDDFPLLVEHFVRKAEDAIGASARKIDPVAVAGLSALPWPENMRGLQRATWNAVAKFPGAPWLVAAHFGELQQSTGELGGGSSPSSPGSPTRPTRNIDTAGECGQQVRNITLDGLADEATTYFPAVDLCAFRGGILKTALIRDRLDARLLVGAIRAHKAREAIYKRSSLSYSYLSLARELWAEDAMAPHRAKRQLVALLRRVSADESLDPAELADLQQLSAALAGTRS
jgi:hypothetical protein